MSANHYSLNLFNVLLLVYCCCLFVGESKAAAVADWIEYEQEQLSVDFDDLDLRQALALASEHTGITFTVAAEVIGVINNVQFDQQPLEAGIKRLLTGYNYMLFHEADEQGKKSLSRVYVMSKISERRPLEASVVATPSAIDTVKEPVQVVLKQRGLGHYIAAGSINGKAVEFLLDTGATTVAISGELANRIGLGYGKAKQIETANGRTTGFETTLYTLTIGALRMHNVRALILPDMTLGRRVLLGMNVLSAFDISKRGDTLVIQQR